MKKNLVLLIFGVILFGSISTAFGYHEYIYRWDTVDTTSVGCHSDVIESETGSMDLILNYTGTLEPRQAFNVTVWVLNFTEATQAPYDNRTTLGIPGLMEDNEKFVIPIDKQQINRRESVDEWGSLKENSRHPEENHFILLAPAEAGTYTLGVLAMSGMNQTDAEDYEIIYVEGTVTITVVAPETTPAIPGFQALYIIVPIAIVAMAVLLKRKVKI